MSRSLVLLAGIVSLLSSALIAQGGAPGAQSAPAPTPRSTALIVGQVVDGSSGEPIPEAVVTLTTMGGRGALPQLPAGAPPAAQQAMQAALAAAGGRDANGPQRVLTGADGRFVFHDLPPGRFQVAADLTGYTGDPALNLAAGLTGLAALGGQSSSNAPLQLSLKEGEFATGVKVRLWRNAVVTGTVLDDAGEPAIGLTVQMARRVFAAGRARYVPAESSRTDDRGMYRIPSLAPGDYLAVVPQTQVSIPTSIMSGLIESITSGGTAGGGGGMALIDVMSSGINPTEAMSGGVRIGDFMVASSGSVPLMGPDGRLQAYQTVFYPGAALPAQATVLTLASGEERSNVDFQLRLVPTARVAGTAMGPDGPVANLGIRLVVPGDSLTSESEFDVATAVTKNDGTFAFYGLPPGRFLLRALKQPRPPIPAEALNSPLLQSMFGSGGAQGSQETLFAETIVDVTGTDRDGVLVQLKEGFKVSGRLEFTARSNRPAPAGQQLQAVSITLLPMDGRMPNILALGTPDRANAQAEFKTKGYAPGKYFLQVSAPANWQLQSAMVGGRDVLDAPLEIRDADVGGVVLSFVDQVYSLTGTVRVPGETDLSETAVLLFPAEYQNWIANGMNPRRGKSARASRDGAFTIGNVPAGDYLAAAVDRVNESRLQDPAYVAALSRLATRVTIGGSSGSQTQDLSRVEVRR